MASILTKFLTPKAVLVVSFDYEYKGVSYNEYLGRELNCVFTTWDELQFVNGEVIVGDRKLHEFKFVVIGTVGKHGTHYAALLACIEACGLPYFSYGRYEKVDSKAVETVKYKQHAIPHPKTVILTAEADKADALIKELKLPLITKIIDGSQGKGVSKHESKESLVKELKARKGELLIVQEALTASCDYRIFFIYEDVMYVDKRSATKKGEFRHNISLGGTLEKVDLPADALAIAKAAQRSMGFDASGVDLIQDEPTGKWYILEVNSAPQFSEPNKVLEKLVSIIQSKL